MIERAGPGDLPAISELLKEESLPEAGADVSFYVARENGVVVGAIGLEGETQDALLRSLVVAAKHRGRGLGKSLVARVQDEASRRGTRSLHLLTTTAQEFFAREGFQVASRESAPPSILATDEFRVSCPASAVYMRREVASR